MTTLRIVAAIGIAVGAASPDVVRRAAAQQVAGFADTATAVWDSAGFVVRFPRSVSPDSISIDMTVSDNFSGYEWRVALIGDRGEALLTAFVIPPDDALALRRYRTVAEAWHAGDLRRCERHADVLACSRPARASSHSRTG